MAKDSQVIFIHVKAMPAIIPLLSLADVTAQTGKGSCWFLSRRTSFFRYGNMRENSKQIYMKDWLFSIEMVWLEFLVQYFDFSSLFSVQLKKKKGKVEVRPINLGTDYEYGVLNVHLTAYDMALAESYAQYIHNLCNHLSIKVEERYGMFLVWVACSALLLLNEVWRYNIHVVKSTLLRYIFCRNLNIE